MLLADLVLIIHFLYVLFVVGSLPVIWLGAWLRLTFVRNPWFRYLHLAAILFVVAESLLGVVCPLTAWENTLRRVETMPVLFSVGSIPLCFTPCRKAF